MSSVSSSDGIEAYFFQQLGRGLRHFVGKEKCIVIDFIGNFQNAYRVVEYQDLDPYDDKQTTLGTTFTRTAKETLICLLVAMSNSMSE
jgi:superfamily II DNA or RNA helicase